MRHVSMKTWEVLVRYLGVLRCLGRLEVSWASLCVTWGVFVRHLDVLRCLGRLIASLGASYCVTWGVFVRHLGRLYASLVGSFFDGRILTNPSAFCII